MKVLTICGIIALVICAILWAVDESGSGMGGATILLAIGLLILLVVNKGRTGSFLSDKSMGR